MEDVIDVQRLRVRFEIESEISGSQSVERLLPAPKVPESIRNILAVARAERTDKQKEDLTAHYRSNAPELKSWSAFPAKSPPAATLRTTSRPKKRSLDTCLRRGEAGISN